MSNCDIINIPIHYLKHIPSWFNYNGVYTLIRIKKANDDENEYRFYSVSIEDYKENITVNSFVFDIKTSSISAFAESSFNIIYDYLLSKNKNIDEELLNKTLKSDAVKKFIYDDVYKTVLMHFFNM